MVSSGVSGSPPVSRRTVLAGALAAAAAAPVAACTGGDGPSDAGSERATPTPAATTAPPTGDAALAAQVLGDEEALLAFCTTAVRRVQRGQRATVRAVQDRQQAIVTALTDAMTDPMPSPRAPIRVPRQPQALLRQLTDVLAAAEESRLADCLAAESGLLARLVASVAASHAVAVEQVRALR